MCLICTEYQKGKLTLNEAWVNLHEMLEVLDGDHVDVVMSMLFFGEQYEHLGDQLILDYGQFVEEDD